MEKLKLNFAYEAGEILTRKELKNVLGGGSGSYGEIGSGSGMATECSASDCSSEHKGLGCGSSELCQKDYNLGICRCQVIRV